VYIYSAYNLSIHSAMPLPELTPLAGAEADVIIHTDKLRRPASARVSPEGSFHFAGKEAHLYWDSVGTFLVRNGNEIIVDPLPGADEQLVRLPLLGSVLSVLLHQRGELVLHASAVTVDGEAVVFMGAKGQGKSTTAAALYAQGHCLIADDTVAISLDDQGRLIVKPGFPQLKLWPEAAWSSLGDEPDNLPRIASGCDKRFRRVSERFSERPVPLSCVYALSAGSTLEIKRATPQEALLRIIANSYAARFGKQLLHGAEAVSHLNQCADLAYRIPIYCLNRPDSLGLLSAVVELVEEQSGCQSLALQG
jgi:HPr Serine kinase C-terminal domain